MHHEKKPDRSGNRGRADEKLPADFTAPIDRLLSRLRGVKQTGPDRWVALCCAHEDRRPSLSIRVLPDGRVLVHCHAGCAAPDVVSGVGMSMADLFERPLDHHRPPLRPRERWIPNDVWQCVAHEAAVAAIVAADAAAGRPVSAEDAKRAGVAADRLAEAIETLGVAK